METGGDDAVVLTSSVDTLVTDEAADLAGGEGRLADDRELFGLKLEKTCRMDALLADEVPVDVCACF